MVEFLAEYSSYVVLGVTLVCWFGIFGYMMITDRKLEKLERK